MESLGVAAGHKVAHALVLCPNEQATDAMLLRAIEQAHGVSDAVQVVVHPPLGAPLDKDRRWMSLSERAAQVHGDVRLLMRLPPPVGMR